MQIKTLQEWIEWAEHIDDTFDETDDSQYEKKLIDVDDLIGWIKEFKDKNASNEWQIRKSTLIYILSK